MKVMRKRILDPFSRGIQTDWISAPHRFLPTNWLKNQVPEHSDAEVRQIDSFLKSGFKDWIEGDHWSWLHREN